MNTDYANDVFLMLLLRMKVGFGKMVNNMLNLLQQRNGNIIVKVGLWKNKKNLIAILMIANLYV